MPTKSYTLIPYHLWGHNIQSWRKSFFCPCPRGTEIFWGPKKSLSQVDMECASLDSYPRWIRYMSTRSHAHTRCGTVRKSSISTRGYVEIHIQGPFLDNKSSIWNILGLKIQIAKTWSNVSSTHRNFNSWKTLKFWFLVVFQSSSS
jgi:hypothetical protein